MDFSKIDLSDNQELARYIIKKAVGECFKDRREFEKFRNRIIKQKKGTIFHNLYFVKAYNDLVGEGKIEPNPHILGLIQKRSVRTQSGVTPVTVMTKPYPCPGRCIYCPTDVRMPKSYLPSQPAAQRAFRQRFNPYTQVFVRLKALMMTGHEISKVELRVIGATWSAYPKQYQAWFLKRCLQAMNEFHDQIKDPMTEKMVNLVRAKVVKSDYGEDEVNTVVLKSLKGPNLSWKQVEKENETGRVRCIGINVETRPDFIDKKEIRRLRRLGVTKVEMGVQTISDEIQKLTGRGHDMASVCKATQLLKDAGFKVGYHMMPNLPGSSVNFDKKMVGELFSRAKPGMTNPFQPDYLKIYPCVVMPKAYLSVLYRKGEYKPYSDSLLEKVLLAELQDVPEWCRVDRIARDIPSDEIEGGFRLSNIRQILEKKLKEEGTPCREIRAREIGDCNVDLENIKLVVREYGASGGHEYFLSYEDVKKDKLIALLRLRFPGENFIKELQDAALIREVHVYGKQVPVGDKARGRKQHIGWGGKLMEEAEKLTRKSGYKKVAVISGIGTREYYKKKNYRKKETYMVKFL